MPEYLLIFEQREPDFLEAVIRFLGPGLNY
jgi:hypothetical protein